jgi:uracil-DNA glycosylase family 4
MRRSNREQCTVKGCPLYKTQWTTKYGGDPNSKVVFVGDSPGKGEQKLNKPLVTSRESGINVDTAGDMAIECAKKAHFDFSTVLLANAARCLVSEESWSKKELNEIVRCCREEHLNRLLRAKKPKIIVVSGKRALLSILKMSGTMKNNYNKWFHSKEYNAWVLVCYHPAAILRNRNLAGRLVNAFRQLKSAIANNYTPRTVAGGKYEEVDNLQDMIDAKLPVGIDTEGQGLDWTDPNYIMLSAQLSNTPGTGKVLRFYEECEEGEHDMQIEWPRIKMEPMKSKPDKTKKVTHHEDVFVRKCDGFESKLDDLASLLRDKKIKKYMMNGNFDVHVFDTTFKRERGKVVPINNYAMDVQAAAHLFNEIEFTMASLSDLQREFAEDKADYNRKFELKYHKGDMLAVPTPDMVMYGGADADITLQVANGLKAKLLKDKKLLRYFVKFVTPALHSLSRLETEGSWIDPEALPRVMKQVHLLMMEHQYKAIKATLPRCKKVYEVPDHVKKNNAKKKKDGIVLTRADLVRDILFSKAGFSIKPVTFTKSKAPSIDKNVRKELLDSRIPDNAREFLLNYTEFSEYHTLYSRYLRGFEKNIKQDGRIHSQLSLTIAVTGRVASSKPNVMNSPKRSDKAKFVRQLISAPPGWLLYAVDESQSELRWLAHVAKEVAMQKVFRDASLDIHTETAKGMIAGRWKDLNPKQQKKARRDAKVVNFGLIFGMSINGLIIYAKQEYDVILSRGQAMAWFDAFFGKYRRIKPFHAETIRSCKRNGYVDSPLGRRRHLPEINSPNEWEVHEAERQAINHPVQGPSSDTVLIALNEMEATDTFHPDYCRESLFIHDELVFELKDCSRLEDYVKMINYHMENPPLERDFGIKLSVPLKAEGNLGKNLNEMKEFTVSA